MEIFQGGKLLPIDQVKISTANLWCWQSQNGSSEFASTKFRGVRIFWHNPYILFLILNIYMLETEGSYSFHSILASIYPVISKFSRTTAMWSCYETTSADKKGLDTLLVFYSHHYLGQRKSRIIVLVQGFH